MDNNSQKGVSKAEVLLKYFYDYNDKQEKIDIKKLAIFFGFIVKEELLLDNIQAKVTISDLKSIIVNKKLEEEYKRYAIAYELAYYFLYCKGGKQKFKHINKLYDDTQVNDLAISLLVRSEEFNNYYEMLKEQYDEKEAIQFLKQYFEIPIEVVISSLKKIKLQSSKTETHISYQKTLQDTKKLL